ncbi:MAG: hypothetical protein AAF770_03660 [Bacteroidota bacterium]
MKQFRKGIPLLGKNAAFTPLLKDFFEQALEAETEERLNETQRSAGNTRNGKGAKTIKSELRTFRIHTLQDS